MWHLSKSYQHKLLPDKPEVISRSPVPKRKSYQACKEAGKHKYKLQKGGNQTIKTELELILMLELAESE